MSLGRYIGTTAISLLKVIVHTSLGSTIRSFKDLHAAKTKAKEDADTDGKAGEISWGEIWTVIGIVLCVGLFIYLSIVARRAVNEECDDEETLLSSSSETNAADGEDDGDEESVMAGGGMRQIAGPNGYTALPTTGGSTAVLPLEPDTDEEGTRTPRAVASSNPFERALPTTTSTPGTATAPSLP